jgi:DNA ligase-1
MERFTALYDELDSTTRTSEKQAALERYFRAAPAADAAWALWMLTGKRPRRAVNSTQLRAWASEASGVPVWLVEESYEMVGDLSETIALLLPAPARTEAMPLARLIEERLLPLSTLDEAGKKALLRRTWEELTSRQRFVFHKLISGSFRVGAARTLVVRGLAAAAGVDPAVMDHRLLGAWKPTAADFERLIARGASAREAGAGTGGREAAQPYPFFLASAWNDDPAELGEPGAWRAEWKWDGIRAQLIRRDGCAMLWTRGEEVASGSFPELVELAQSLPTGTVLDGEVLAWEEGGPLPFALLQRRLNRANVEPRLFQDVPVVFMAYDVLEHGGVDVRREPIEARLAMLEELVRSARSAGPLHMSRGVEFAGWDELAMARSQSRSRGVEGVMLKRLGSAYGTGRTRGDWWKWKVEPYALDMVLTHAQPGSGKRSGLFTDYTFGLRLGDGMVTAAKAYSGLSDAEIREVDAFVRGNTLSRHGPVRAVEPRLVFEIAFEGVQESGRHSSGLAVRFPRISRWRRDKQASDASTVDDLRELVRAVTR